jgi:TIR domain
MPFRHACFISYRHGQYDLMKRFVEDFYAALASELEAVADLPLYRDLLRLQGGDFYNEELARSLCESVCMIVVYTPTYFNASHRYCTREYAAMKALENSRLAKIQAEGHHGLIIPVVLRGFDQLPAEIKERRHVYNFDRFLLSDQALAKNPSYNADIKKMAEYIAARCRDLEELQPDCGQFELPSDQAVEQLVHELSGRVPPFPGREAYS